MSKAQVIVPASTTNLGPGFDVLGMALNLYNTFEVETSDKLNIEVEGEGSDTLSRDESNLVYQSAKKLFDSINEKTPPLNIRIINNIPLARGLGSSGTAIVGGLMATNAISGNPLSLAQILNLAAEMDGHPDNVSASMLGGVTIASLTDNGIAYIKLIPPKPLTVAVVVPDFHIMTSKARKLLPKSVDLPTAVFNIGRVSLLVAALTTGDFSLFGISMDDKLHQPYRAELIPGIYDVFNAAKSVSKNVAVAISGAGSAIAAFCYDTDCHAVGESMRKAFLKHNVNSYVLILDIDKEGTRVSSF
jgi:homoserine kinase